MICSVMETDRLKQFCLIVETGSMTKAAGLLHITHSGLSKSMKQLQEQLGFRLMQTSGRGLSITPHGQKFYLRAKELLKLTATLYNPGDSINRSELRIGTVEIFLTVLCASLNKLFENHENITLLDLNPEEIEQMLVKGHIDFGITYVPFPMNNLEIIEIGAYRLGCYHLTNTFEKENLHDIPFVVPARRLSTNFLGIKERDGWLESISTRRKKFHVNLLSTAIELTLQGVCAIYMPEFIANKINHRRPANQKLIERPLPKMHTQSIYLIRHKYLSNNTPYTKIQNVLKNFCSLPPKF